MADVTLKDVPESLYRRLEKEAQNHGWPVDREALICLATYFEGDRMRAPLTLEEIRSARSHLAQIHLTDQDLERARNEGRA